MALVHVTMAPTPSAMLMAPTTPRPSSDPVQARTSSTNGTRVSRLPPPTTSKPRSMWPRARSKAGFSGTSRQKLPPNGTSSVLTTLASGHHKNAHPKHILYFHKQNQRYHSWALREHLEVLDINTTTTRCIFHSIPRTALEIAYALDKQRTFGHTL